VFEVNFRWFYLLMCVSYGQIRVQFINNGCKEVGFIAGQVVFIAGRLYNNYLYS